MKNIIAKELIEAAEAMREYIDALPQDIELPVMPGMNRDWVDGVIAMAKVDLDPEACKPTDQDICEQVADWNGHESKPPTDGLGAWYDKQ